MSKEFSVVAKIVARADDFVKGINEAKSKADSFSQSFAEKSKKLSEGFNKVGKGMTKYVTTPIAGLATAAVAIGANFDKQMSKVQAVSGATGKEFDKLRDTALELSKSTKYTATEAAEGMEYLALAGWKTNDIIEAMPGMLDLAAAGALDLGRAADITSDVMSAFGLSADKATHAADVFAYAQANANTSVEQMGEGMTYLAPIANALGWDLEQSSAAMMSLANSGVKGSMAGQAFATSLARLAKPTKAMSSTMKKLGIEFFDANGTMKSLPDVLAEIEKGTKGMTQEQKSAVLTTLFGAQAYKHWAIMLDDGSEKLGEMTEELRNADGTARTMAETMMDNLGGAINMLQAALQLLAIQFSDLIKDDVKKFAEWLQRLVTKFTELDDGTKKVILVIGLIASAIGPLLITLGFMATGLSVVVGALGAISAPVLAVIGVIAALVAGFTLAYNKLESFRDGIHTVIEAIKTVISGFVENFKQSFENLKEGFEPTLNKLKELFASLEPILSVVGALIGGTLVVSFGILLSAINGLTNAIAPLVNSFLDLVSFITNVVMTVVSLLTGDYTAALDYWNQATQNSIDFFVNLWNTVVGFVSGFVTTIIDFFYNLYMTLVGNSIIPDMVNAIIRWFHTLLAQGISIVTNIVQSIIKWFLNLYTQATSIFQNIFSTSVSIWNAIKSTVVGIVSSLWSSIVDKFNSILSSAQSIFNSVRSAITTALSNAYTTARSIVGNMFSSIRTTFNNILSTAQSIFNSVKSAITKPIQAAKDTVLGIIDTIKTAFSNMKITIPKPKIPKVNISMGTKNIAGASIPFPKFDVSWFSKGGIFSNPAIVGLAEAGREAILPIQDRNAMKPFSDQVSNHITDKLKDILGAANTTIYYDINLRVDNLKGTKNDAEILLEEIITGVKLKGGKI